jgi:small-conductance mechanosensitive channel
MVYMTSFLPSFFSNLDLANIDLTKLLQTNIVVKIAESSGLVSMVAGIVALVASTFFNKAEYFNYGILIAPLGFGLWYYASEFEKVYEELKSLLSLSDAANEIGKEGNEIEESTQLLKKETDRLESSSREIKEQTAAFSQVNDKIEPPHG